MASPPLSTGRIFRRWVHLTRVAVLTALTSGVTHCGLGDRATMECRCVPDTNLNLFPGCPSIAEVMETDDEELWITADGDTLNAASDWITIKGRTVRHSSGTTRNPFSAAMPDCPVGPRLMLNEPIRASLVLFNLRNILLAEPEARNLDQYMDQFSQDFTFIPDIQDIQLYPEIYDVTGDTLWNRDQERRFAQAFLSSLQVGSITLTRWYESSRDERHTSEDQLTETYIFPYEGRLTRLGGGDTKDVIVEFKGHLEIDLVTPTLENPLWSVHQWRDFRDPASAKRSWGELRAEFVR